MQHRRLVHLGISVVLMLALMLVGVAVAAETRRLLASVRSLREMFVPCVLAS